MASSPSSVFRLAEAGPKLMRGNGQFAWDMFKKLSSDGAAGEGENVLYSPASISLALAMTYAGARNETRAQMRAALGFSEIEDDADVHACFEDLHTHLHNTGDEYVLRTANRIYLEKTFAVLSSFLDTTKTHYKAEVSLVDFQTAFDAARQSINGWVAEQTADKIQGLLQEGVLDSLTRLVLVNAIYFKGNWLEQFDPARTTDADFHVSASEKLPLKLMYQEKKFRYGYNKDIGAKVLELPYVGNRLSMFLLLPSKHHALNEVITKLTADHIFNFEKTFQMEAMKTQVHLPRFKLEQSIDLGDTLAALGMKDLFDQSKADLSGIDGTNQLYVSKVVHKAFIEVNEEGSEAAAATAVKVGLRSMPRILEFRANQPFLFFIRENTSNSILFFGRVVNPAAAAASKEEL